MLRPPTASPVPSTSRSSSSPRLIPDLGSGLNIGLASIVARNVGLDVIQTGRDNVNPDIGKEFPIVGDEAAELTAELGMVIGKGIGNRELPPDARGDMRAG
jgi:hypothetical protein